MSAEKLEIAVISVVTDRVTDDAEIRLDIGPFSSVRRLELCHGNPDSHDTQLAAVELALRSDADWMIVLDVGEKLSADAFALVEPSLDLFDAIYGAAHFAGRAQSVSRLSRLAFDSADRLPHALLNWWMPRAHFVRPEVAADVLKRIDPNSRQWRLDYLFALWAGARCLKSAQPLLDLDSDPTPLDPQGRDAVLSRLETRPVFLPVIHGDDTYFLPYTGRNAGIEREQSRGLFFEAMELEELRKIVRPGAHIVDIGANTGNHTVFFAGPMRAASVTPFEPMPQAANVLRATVKKNKLHNVNLSALGVGISDRPGHASPVFSERGGLGATGLRSDDKGQIVVTTLDSVLSASVDLLKIDVEGMEMQVLRGAQKTIALWKPAIFIEVANHNTTEICKWLSVADYRVARVFTDKGHANYLLMPRKVRE